MASGCELLMFPILNYWEQHIYSGFFLLIYLFSVGVRLPVLTRFSDFLCLILFFSLCFFIFPGCLCLLMMFSMSFFSFQGMVAILFLFPYICFLCLWNFMTWVLAYQNSERSHIGNVFNKLLKQIGNPVDFELPDWFNKWKPMPYTFIKRSILLSLELTNFKFLLNKPFHVGNYHFNFIYFSACYIPIGFSLLFFPHETLLIGWTCHSLIFLYCCLFSWICSICLFIQWFYMRWKCFF